MEIAPDAGIFEIDFTIRYTDGPDSTLCPDTDNYVGTDGATQNTDPLIRFDTLPINEENFCILQGDIITVEYTDPADASGSQNIVTDSATFDLRNGVLQSDKSVYIIGSDMILTLIEPDFDLDNDHAEIYDLDLIQWNSDAATLTVGDAGGQTGTGVVRVIDSDMNLNSAVIDHFIVDVWSDSDAQGIELHLVETNQATGIFDGTVFFTTIDESLGHKLRISEGDNVTAEYEDNTLPDPYTPSDELDLTATVIIDSNPPDNLITLDNARIVDAFGNMLDEILVNQQVQVSSDIENQASTEQPFAYALFVHDANGVQINQESWITGSISVGQSFSPALSWIPAETGDHILRVELWNNAADRELLDDPIELIIDVVEPQPIFCNDMTIDELIASGNYNVIDNRDGHLDGSKIKGTNGDDLILASDAGNDIRAKKGNDCVIGGAGNDQLRGGNGDDIMFGLDGNDRMIGGKQNDLLYGGEGNDKISGSKNNDQLYGENGDDNIHGGSGDDALSCGDGTDKANGGKGTDTAAADCETVKKVP